MTAYGLITRPCGWDTSAPKALRQSVFGRTSTWAQYSSSKYLNGSNPNIWDKSDKISSSPCPSLTIELLSGESSKPWERLGLQFAKERHIEGTRFVDTLVEALVLIEGNREIHATVKSMCRSLHPLVCDMREVDVSFSDPELPFSIFVSCPPLEAQHRIERLAENIVHEALHLQLTLVERAKPLVLANADENLVYSPWKKERRNLSGLIHGIYVFGNLREFWANIAEQTPQSVEFGKERVTAIEAEMRNLVHVVESSKLTTSGQVLLSSYLAPYRLNYDGTGV